MWRSRKNGCRTGGHEKSGAFAKRRHDIVYLYLIVCVSQRNWCKHTATGRMLKMIQDETGRTTDEAAGNKKSGSRKREPQLCRLPMYLLKFTCPVASIKKLVQIYYAIPLPGNGNRRNGKNGGWNGKCYSVGTLTGTAMPVFSHSKRTVSSVTVMVNFSTTSGSW